MNSIEKRLATLTLAGATVAACSGSNVVENNTTPSSTPSTHTEIVVGACPPGYQAPWEAPRSSIKPAGANTDAIELVVWKNPTPTPKPNQVECFYKIDVQGSAESN